MIARHKNRYMLIESSEPADTRYPSVMSAVSDSISAEMGQTGYMRANPKIVHQFCDTAFIIRVNRGYEHDLTLATAFVKTLSGRRVSLYTISTSGTIRKLLDTARGLYGAPGADSANQKG